MIRRAIGTTLAGLCALTGPLATSALADTAPALNLSVASARQGVPFTVNGAASCPSDSGQQTVQFSFTDSAGLIYPVGQVATADDGSWSGAVLALPVAGVDDSGVWQDNGTAAGAGTLAAICVVSASTADPGDGSGDDPGVDPGDGSSGVVDQSRADDPNGDPSADPGGDTSTDPAPDPGDGADVTTLTYTPAALTVIGTAPQVSVSAVSADHSVTVSPAEACAGTGASTVTVAVVAVGDNASDTPLATGSATSTDSGVWAPVTLTLPGDATGDYAVTTVCAQGDVVTSSYDAMPLALGTVLLSKPDCTARGALARVTGTYSGTVAIGGKSLKQGLVKLNGAGPWKVSLHSVDTGELLLSQTVACATPMYNLDVSKSGFGNQGQIRVRVCNTGRASVTAILQTMSGKHGDVIDRETLDATQCVWLAGGKVHHGEAVKAQVLADPPGGGSSNADVAATFSLHRGKH